MPAKNSIKTYRENSFYHVYNRGVNKSDIFLDDQDYQVFLSYLKIYLSPKDTENLKKICLSTNSSYHEKEKASKLLLLKNYSDEIDLLCYALMPNHFHFLVKQRSSDGINRFLRSLATKYSMYFNKKYVRVGSLFQGVYKAVLVETEGQLLHLTRYIHKNPRSGSTQPTSLPEYLGVRRTPWVKPGEILNFFSKTNSNDSYQSFLNESADWSLIADYMVDVDSQGETLRG